MFCGHRLPSPHSAASTLPAAHLLDAAAGAISDDCKWLRLALLVFRLSVFLWQSAVLGTLIAYKYPSFREFAFYTVWNYILQTGWWLSAVAVSGCSIASVQPPRWMCEISYVLFSVSMPASMLVSIVMWTILAPHDIAHGGAPADINFFSFNMHAANTVLLLAEFAVNRVLIGSDALVYLVCWMCCYCAFTWIFEAFEHWWPYFFCDLSTWAALGWYTALLLLHLVAFAVAILFSRTKARLTKGLGPPALRLAETPTATAADALFVPRRQRTTPPRNYVLRTSTAVSFTGGAEGRQPASSHFIL